MTRVLRGEFEPAETGMVERERRRVADEINSIAVPKIQHRDSCIQ